MIEQTQLNNQQPPVQQPESDPRRVYVSNLDPSVSNRKTEANLTEIFTKYGEVKSIMVKRNEKHKKLFAFVIFNTAEEAADAIDNLDNSYFGDEKIKVEHQRGHKFQGGKRENNHSNPVTCYRCQKVGHFARECKETLKRKSRSRSRSADKDRRQKHEKRRSREKRRHHSSSSSNSQSSSDSHRDRRRNRSRSRSSSGSDSSSSR